MLELGVMVSAGFDSRAGTYSEIEKQLPEKLVDELTGAQLALVMQAINEAYQKGKASTGAEMIDNNAVYINRLNKIIEWNEEDAEYIRETVSENGYKVTRSRKIKNGVLVPRFSE